MQEDNQPRDVYMEEKDLAEIERIAESWVGQLPFEAVYELAKRFHFHLTLKLFIEDSSGFQELRRTYGELGEESQAPKLVVTEKLLSQLDRLLGFSMGDTEIEPDDNLSGMPDKEFIKCLGID